MAMHLFSHKYIQAFITTTVFLLQSVSICYAQIPDDLQDAFDRIDQIGKRTEWRSDFVEVSESWSQPSDREKHENPKVYGFLLRSSDTDFDILGLDLETRNFERQLVTEDLLRFSSSASYRAIDLNQHVHRLVENSDSDHPHFHNMRIDRATQLIVFARAAEFRKDTVAMWELVEFAKQHLWENETWQDKVDREFATAEFWRIVLAFSDLKISRDEIKSFLFKFTKDFPESEHLSHATLLEIQLTEMAYEEAHRTRKENLDDLTENERIEELIYRLRDQHGEQFSQPGWCDIFSEDRMRGWSDFDSGPIPESSYSPAMQLVHLGFAAVPKLIDHLGDDLPTRSVGYHRDFYFSHHILSTGECLRRILESISGNSFRATGDDSTRDLVVEWWQKAEAKGEKQMLIDQLERSEGQVEEFASLLAKKFPSDAFDPIRKAILQVKDHWHATKLMRVLASMPRTENIDGFFLELLNTSFEFTIRVQAATCLLSTPHRSAGIEGMIREISSMSEADCERNQWDIDSLLEGLLETNDPSSITALRDSFRKLVVSNRIRLIEKIRFTECQANDAELLNEPIEELLIQALEDTSRDINSAIGGWVCPRVCDVASSCIATRYPTQYSMEWPMVMSQMDRQRFLAINDWRARHDIELLQAKKVNLTSDANSSIEQRLNKEDSRAIVEVVIAGMHPPSDSELSKHIEHLRGTRMEAETPAELIAAIVAYRPPGLKRAIVHIERSQLATGVKANIELIEGKDDRIDTVNHSMYLLVGREFLHNVFGGGTVAYLASEMSNSDLTKSLEKAIKANPDAPFEVFCEIEFVGSHDERGNADR